VFGLERRHLSWEKGCYGIKGLFFYMRFRFVSVAISFILASLQANAASCPKDYFKRYQDQRNGKVAEYWIVTVPKDSDTSLRKANVLSTYNSISKERASDFKCTFKKPYEGFTVYDEGRCSNSAGYDWDPTGLYSQGSGYQIDSQGSYTVSQCSSSYGCGIFVDKSGTRFIVNPDFKATLYDMSYSDKYSFAMLRDGTGDMVIEAIVLRPLFVAGDKRYVTISREIESGFYCTYQGGASPNI